MPRPASIEDLCRNAKRLQTTNKLYLRRIDELQARVRWLESLLYSRIDIEPAAFGSPSQDSTYTSPSDVGSVTPSSYHSPVYPHSPLESGVTSYSWHSSYDGDAVRPSPSSPPSSVGDRIGAPTSPQFSDDYSPHRSGYVGRRLNLHSPGDTTDSEGGSLCIRGGAPTVESDADDYEPAVILDEYGREVVDLTGASFLP